SLEILSRITRRLGNNRDDDGPHDLERLIDFFKVFVDTFHHGKEEELVFPSLERVGVSREGGPIGVMLVEHDAGRDHMRSLRVAIDEYRAGDKSAAAEIQKQADAYARLLKHHIEKENQVLFRIAENHLPDETRDSLEKGFEIIEATRVGSETL